MEEISQKLSEVIQEIFDVKIEPEVSVAPEGIEADYSTNVAMKLAKVVHKSPMEIAEEIQEKIEVKDIKITVFAPGFLNFTLADQYFIEQMNKDVVIDTYKDQTVICEFSDPNPFKVLHVGHLYTSIVGDSLSRLFECAGAKVIRANFGGDV